MIGLLLMTVFLLAGIGIQLYGTVLCFKKSFWHGVASMFVPGVSLVVGIAKLFKVDLIKTTATA